jgi:hypothetical protein
MMFWRKAEPPRLADRIAAEGRALARERQRRAPRARALTPLAQAMAHGQVPPSPQTLASLREWFRAVTRQTPTPRKPER